jgi:hypothetical protein
LLASALVVAGVILPASALGGAARVTTNSQTYTDSVGEDAQAPDITSVAVSNDDAGLITFKVNISNRPALTQDMLLQIALDTDNNPATGDPDGLGSEYLLNLVPGEVELGKWNGSQYMTTPSTSVTFAYDATGATIHVSQADLGGTKLLNFNAVVVSGIVFDATGNPDFTNAHADFAPDAGHGAFNYQVITKLTVKVTTFTVAPKPAKAGKAFSAALAATESDTNGPVTKGTITCAATIAGKKIPATHRLANGIATCQWKLPKTSKHKTLRGTVTLIVQGVTVKRTFSSRIS